MRCATGWIRQCLRDHPDVFLPRFETHFFDRNYDKGLSWWEEKYFKDYRGEKAVGEKTATYLHEPEVPKRILDSLPDVKLICCLRDPIERMYSHYLMLARNDKTLKSTSFLDAIALDSSIIQKSMYFTQIKLFLNFFPREKLLVKIYEDKDINPVGFIRDILNFLEVDSTIVPQHANIRTKPGSLENRNKIWLATSRIMLHNRSPLLLKRVYSRIRPMGEGLELDEDSLRNTAGLFEEDIEELERFLNRDLRCWRSKRLGG
jgi:hypothetical protein